MNTPNSTHASSDTNPAQLEREVDRQREHIGGLVDALESKLSPGEIFERVLSYGKGGGSEFVGNLGNTVKANPVPALLTAAGLVWLYASSNSSSHASHSRHAYVTGGGAGTGLHGAGMQGAGMQGASTRDTHGTHGRDSDHGGVGERLREARDGISDRMEHASESMSHLKDRASDMTHDAMDSARDRTRQVNDGFHHMLEDNPLAVGAIGIAVGALLGALLPSTRKEDELLGATSDRLTDQAKSMAKQGYEQAAQAGRELGKPQDDNADQKFSSGRNSQGGSDAGQSGSGQTGGHQGGSRQTGYGQTGPSQSGSSPGTASQSGSSQGGSNQTGTAQVGTGQSSFGHSGSGQTGASQTGPGSTSPGQSPAGGGTRPGGF